ncbi:MAG TPA: Wzz/FepE/Etk N-terminal domain-containing protein [bacterium]|nr:Wzz/FepE/Etk N-terminal domain-containing protein [bacterium]
MEFREIFKKIRKNRQVLALCALIGLITGVLIHFLPSNYTASGSFYITRKEDNSESFFTYEGYYSQQTASTYTNSVVALAESEDVKKQVLNKLDLPEDGYNIRKISKSMSVKKTGPQIINIAFKDKDLNKSKTIWETIADTLIDTSKEINRDGDGKLAVVKISEEPFIKQFYKPLLITSVAGILVGFSLGIFIISLKEYFKH